MQMICPLDGTVLDQQPDQLGCPICGARYPVRDGNPPLCGEQP